MSSTLAAAVEAIHALLMLAWILGVPLLFVRRWPRLTRAYGMYAVAFVVVTRLSDLALGECFLTSAARRLWQAGSRRPGTDEWFSIRFARLIFGMTPSHRAIAWISEGLILITAVGVLASIRRDGRGALHAGSPRVQRNSP